MSDLEYLRRAYEIAAKESTDPSTQNAAILVERDRSGEFYRQFNDVGGVDYVEWLASERREIHETNHFPRDVPEIAERWVRPLKYMYVEHAERNVIYRAAREGFITQGAIMYATWIACDNCARAIIQSGIVEVVTHHDPFAKVRFGKPVSDVWLQSVAVGLTMMKEAGVKIRWIDDKIFPNDEVKIRFNEELVSP